MKLIIDIPDTIGKHIRDSYNIHLSDATLMKVKKAIKNGTPLDKIRAEIEETKDKIFCTDGERQGLDVALGIIDKYMAEGE